MQEEEKTTEAAQEGPKSDHKHDPRNRLGKRSVLTGSEVIELTEDADYEYSPPQGSMPASPEEQAENPPKPRPTAHQQPSQENQGRTQEEPQQQE